MKSNPDRPMPVRSELVRSGKMDDAGEPGSVAVGSGFAVLKLQAASRHGASAAYRVSAASKGG